MPDSLEEAAGSRTEPLLDEPDNMNLMKPSRAWEEERRRRAEVRWRHFVGTHEDRTRREGGRREGG
jgi:hypothetical protein